MKEDEFKFIGGKIADILDNINDTKLQETIKEELKKLAQNFVIYTKSTY
jgi:glycine hydroxymethyltransferase